MSRPVMPGFAYDAKKKRAVFDIFVPGGKGKVRRKKTVSVRSIEEARRLYAEFRASFSSAPAEKEVTFAKFVESELPRVVRRVRLSTAAWYCDIVRARLLPHFGQMVISAVTKAAADDFVHSCLEDRERPVSPARINGCLRVLKLLMHVAVERGYIANYPLRELKTLSRTAEA